VLVVWRLDRLGRNLAHLVQIVGELEIRAQRHPRAHPVGPEGGARPRAVGGRPAKLSAKDKQQIRVLLKDPAVRVKDAAKRFGVSVATLYNRVGVVTPDP
jgi:DNA invertase Pin-like site-specific DNA recombinase